MTTTDIKRDRDHYWNCFLFPHAMAQPTSSSSRSVATSSALRALALEFKSLEEEPVEGFKVNLVNDDNLFEWLVAIFGPPDTLYEGGYFKVS